jgi:biofilm PGA synthesis lipoprotein PgaB
MLNDPLPALSHLARVFWLSISSLSSGTVAAMKPPFAFLRSLLAALLGLGLALTPGFGLLGSGAQARSTAPPDPYRGLIVLAYHEIAEGPKTLERDFAVTPEHFQAQIGWLAEHGYHFASIDELLAAQAGRRRLPPRSVLLSFDDGYRSFYDNAFPVLKRHRAPAVLGLVGSWLEAPPGLVRFGDELQPRERFLSWEQLKEMERSGLVEAGSHTYDLHRGVTANPQRNSEPAVTTRLYRPGKGYESEGDYRRRLRDDLVRNSDLLQARLGHPARAVVWPYGRYNATAAAVATGLGMPVGLTLDDGANRLGVPLKALRRVLMTAEMGGSRGLERELAVRERDAGDTARAVKAMHVDLDNIYDPNPAQIERNLKLLLERIRAMGVNTVYLQAYADPDGDGAADSVYFPNRHLPVRADLFNHVAWEIRTRTQVRRLYAWMPVLAFTLPKGHPAATDRVVTLPNRSGHLSMGYPRLSPFSPRAMAVVEDIYTDLSRRATFDGVLFHDDVTLSDYEDASPDALRQYRRWGLPTDLAKIRSSDDLLGRWTNRKTDALEQITLHLADKVRENQAQLRTARNLYAQVVLNPHAESWYSQSLDDAIRDYDFTAVMAMPYMEKAGDPQAFLGRLVAEVKQKPHGLERVLFELQTTDWHTRTDIPSQELAAQVRDLYRLGARHVGYYPDNIHRGTPDPSVLRPVFMAHSSDPVLAQLPARR